MAECLIGALFDYHLMLDIKKKRLNVKNVSIFILIGNRHQRRYGKVSVWSPV